MTARETMQAERYTRWAWAMAILWIGVILLAGSDLGSDNTTSRFLGPFLRWLLPDASGETIDRLYYTIRKGAHVAEYGMLAVLAQAAWRVRLPALAGRFAAALVWVLAVAALDEGRQSFSDQRTGSLGDVALDFGGGVLALVLTIAYIRAMQGRRSGRAQC